MRQAGTIPNEAAANRFVDYLLTLGIEAKTDAAADGYLIWIYDENQLAKSKEELNAFLLKPDGAKYANVEKKAKTQRRDARVRQKAASRNIINVRNRWSTPGATNAAPVTYALMAISLVVGLLTQFGEDNGPVRSMLSIASLNFKGSGPAYLPGLQEVRHGEIWRLVTPIFIHFGIFHFLFNMYWLWIFGRLIESRRGSLRFANLVLVSAIASNLAQYAYEGPELIFFGNASQSGPFFGGMSGVGYALFGYCWIRSHISTTEPPYLDSRTTFLFLVWFVVCLTGRGGPVANVAHGVGLLVGMAAGYLPKLLRQ